MSRKIEFIVPTDVSTEFVEAITDRHFENTMTGVTEEDDLIIEVSYDKEDSEIIEELEELLETLIENLAEEDDDSEEEEEEEEDND